MILTARIDSWKGGLIVSCQAGAGSPMAAPQIIAALAQIAERNGAVGVRIDGGANISAVRRVISIPILGIEKLRSEACEVYITPTCESAARVASSGADVIAVDGTPRARPGGAVLRDIVSRVRTEFQIPVMADIATADEAIQAVETAGADLVGTTLSGYTQETKSRVQPDLELVRRLASRLKVPVICEGHVRSTEDVRRAFDSGAFAVVVGKAITGVDWLVHQYVLATPGHLSEKHNAGRE